MVVDQIVHRIVGSASTFHKLRETVVLRTAVLVVNVAKAVKVVAGVVVHVDVMVVILPIVAQDALPIVVEPHVVEHNVAKQDPSY